MVVSANQVVKSCRKRGTTIWVTVIDPNRELWDVEINANFDDDDALLQELIKTMSLPTMDGGVPIEYGINLIGGVKVEEGSVIQIFRFPSEISEGRGK